MHLGRVEVAPLLMKHELACADLSVRCHKRPIRIKDDMGVVDVIRVWSSLLKAAQRQPHPCALCKILKSCHCWAVEGLAH